MHPVNRGFQRISPSSLGKSSSVGLTHRPSSPRQFFARLYGHLETGPSVKNDAASAEPPQEDLIKSDILTNDIHFKTKQKCDASYQSDISSSPDIVTEERHCDNSSVYPTYAPEHLNGFNVMNSAPNHIGFIPDSLNGKSGFGFPADTHFPVGLTAFCCVICPAHLIGFFYILIFLFFY